MDSITELIKAEIKKQYKSVRQFSEKSGIPYSTLSNALAKGVGGTSYDTVNKILELLNLKAIRDGEISLLNPELYEIYNILTRLDDNAIQAVKRVLFAEHQRCISGNVDSPIINNRLSTVEREVGGKEGEARDINDK